MRRRAITALAVLLTATATGQHAQANVATPTWKGLWEQNQEVPFRWKADGVPPDWMKSAVTGAAADSKKSRAAKAPTFVLRTTADSWVTYSADLPSAAALAYASRNAPTSFRVWMRVQGHVFDWGTLRWCQFYSSPPKGCFDARTVALHEFGHIHGLKHSSVQPPDTIMQPTSLARPKEHYDMREFGRCDVAALQVGYEALTPSTPISTCLLLATDLVLASSATSISSGSSVTMTATLRISPDVEYPNLAADMLSSRTVILQRRSPGVSSWTTHGQMPAASGDGRYRLAVAPTTTYEWRAVFNQPAGEGLEKSTSALVKVTVSSGCTSNPCPI
jgi:hypothetical protein